MKRVISLFIAMLICPALALAQQTQLDSDTFGNGSPSNGTLLSSYTPATGTWVAWGTNAFNNEASIEGMPGVGTAAANQTGGAYKSGPTWTNDQYCQITVDATTTPNHLQCLLRAQTAGVANGYFGGEDNIDFTFYYSLGKYVTGTPTRLQICASGGVPGALLCDCSVVTCPSPFNGTNGQVQTGDIINFQVQGSVLTLQVKRGAGAFVTILTGTDNTCAGIDCYTTGFPGLVVEHSTTARLAGSWLAGSVGGVAASGPRFLLTGVK